MSILVIKNRQFKFVTQKIRGRKEEETIKTNLKKIMYSIIQIYMLPLQFYLDQSLNGIFTSSNHILV